MARSQPKYKSTAKNPGTRAGRARSEHGQSYNYEDIQQRVEEIAAQNMAKWARKWKPESEKKS